MRPLRFFGFTLQSARSNLIHRLVAGGGSIGGNRLSRILVEEGSHTLSWCRANYKRRQERAGARADPIVSELQTSGFAALLAAVDSECRQSQ